MIAMHNTGGIEKMIEQCFNLNFFQIFKSSKKSSERGLLKWIFWFLKILKKNLNRKFLHKILILINFSI